MRHLSDNRIVVAAALLPMLLGALVLWSTSARVDRVDAVPAAVVNLDEPVRNGPEGRPVAAGRLLAAGLTEPVTESAESLAWRLTSAAQAREGLRDGDYHAVVTIPEDFSRTVAGLTRNEPEKARITVRSNGAASALVSRVSDQIGEAAAARLNQRITATFLEGMYAQTGELKASLGDAEQGAGRLADGVGRLEAGTSRLSAGAGELAGGLGRLDSGAGSLAEGAGRVAAGAERLAGGTARLRQGADRLGDGAGELSGGLRELRTRTALLPGRTRDLAEGAGRVADGVGGWSKVLLGWQQACRRDPVLAASHVRLCAATTQAVGADQGNAEAMVSGSRRLAAGADRLADATPRLTSGIARAASGAQRLDAGAGRLATGARQAERGAERLGAGADRLEAGARDLAAGARKASAAAERLAGGSTRLATGADRLRTGSRELATGLGKGAARLPGVDADRRRDLADAVAAPVESRTDRLNPVASTVTSFAPGVLAVAVWLGAFVAYLVRSALPARALAAALPAHRVTLAGWWPAVALGLVQGALLWAMLGLLGVAMSSPAGVAAFLLVPVLAFTALNQSFVALLGRRRGWLALILFTVVQVVSLAGPVPLATAPPTLQAVSGFLPVSLAAEGLGVLTLDGQVGSVAAASAGLLGWGVAALAVTVLAARRRQRSSLADVRRRVTGGPASHAVGRAGY